MYIYVRTLVAELVPIVSMLFIFQGLTTSLWPWDLLLSLCRLRVHEPSGPRSKNLSLREAFSRMWAGGIPSTSTILHIWSTYTGTPTHTHTYKIASASSYKQITKTRTVVDGKQLVLLTASSLWSRVAFRASRKPKTMQAQRNSYSKTAFLMVKQLPRQAKLTKHVIRSVINQRPTFIFNTCKLQLYTRAYIAITSSLPLKRGSPVCISASMQPRDHMSMDRSYGIPNRTSGDR